jgi:glutathione S-transferase
MHDGLAVAPVRVPKMLLIGLNRSPSTRRVAITLKAYHVAFAHKPLSGFDGRSEVRALNPLGRIPALVLDDDEVLIDSWAIIDHLDEVYGGERQLTPRTGPNRRAVLRVAAMMMGACDKGLQRRMRAITRRRKSSTNHGSTTASHRWPTHSRLSTR